MLKINLVESGDLTISISGENSHLNFWVKRNTLSLHLLYYTYKSEIKYLNIYIRPNNKIQHLPFIHLSFSETFF